MWCLDAGHDTNGGGKREDLVVEYPRKTGKIDNSGFTILLLLGRKPFALSVYFFYLSNERPVTVIGTTTSPIINLNYFIMEVANDVIIQSVPSSY